MNMTPTRLTHLPVLRDEILELLVTNPDGYYVDGTYGRGGHSQAILTKLSANGHLLALDKDPTAIEHAQQISDARFQSMQADFATLDQIADTIDIVGKINGILLDIGVSSPQLDNPERGFSFMRNGPLDMRMNPTQGESVAQWLNKVKEKELYQVLTEFGEERYAKRIARAILQARTQAPITTTHQLADIVRAAHPRWPKDKHPATQTFQAMRIFINQELAQLKTVLTKCIPLLVKGGRLAVITFHSLEDRLVKNFIQEQLHGNPLFPFVLFKTSVRLVSKAIRPSAVELSINPRARSATLRILEKIA